MSKPPAFQFYAKDWLSSATVRKMSMHHRGIYISVLAAMWDSEEPGTLPLPIEDAARSAGIDPRSLRDFVAKFPKCLSQIDTEIAETSTRLRRDIAETSTRSHVDVSPMSVPMLVNLKLRAQWKAMQQRQQLLSDAGKRGNEKKWGKSSGGESGGDRSASASASASAEEGCSLLQLSQDHQSPKLHEPVPIRSLIEEAIGKTAKSIKPSAATNGGQRAHLEAGIYRKKIEAAYFDATRAKMKPDECIGEAIYEGALSLVGNRSIELRGLDHEDLARNAWERIQNSVAALHEMKNFELRSKQIVAVVTRCLTDVALEFWERTSQVKTAAR